MKALIADDDRAAVLILQRTLARWDIPSVTAANGADAWNLLRADPSIGMGIFDWMMPGLEGPSLCRQIRQSARHDHMYLLLLTNRDSRTDLIEGLDAGADDYIVKPFDLDELRARVQVGRRVLALQHTLTERALQLQAATTNITRLRKLIPICSYCRKIRSDQDYWQQLEEFLAEQGDLEFSHGVCPTCYEEAKQQMSEE